MKITSEEVRTLKSENSNIKCIRYTLLRKNVKNINLRIKLDGSVTVSANRRISTKYIDEFVLSKEKNIVFATEKYEEIRKNAKPQIEHTADECRPLFEEIACETHKRFLKYNIVMPQIKIRKMKSRWGSCMPTRGIITLNTNLFDKPKPCIEYVVLHEFCHFIHQNHSKEFYNFVSMLMPDWKERKKLLES